MFLEVGNSKGRASNINQISLQIHSVQHRFAQKEGRGGEEVHSGRKCKFIWEINDHIMAISI